MACFWHRLLASELGASVSRAIPKWQMLSRRPRVRPTGTLAALLHGMVMMIERGILAGDRISTPQRHEAYLDDHRLRGTGTDPFMDLGDLIKPDAVLTGLRAQSKKALLGELSLRAGELLKIDQSLIHEAVQQREMLSSTGLGRGIAIPHARMKQVTAMFGLFARLEHPIAFDAMDGEPVDLVFLLLAPDGAGADHLRALARVSRLMRDAPTLDRLRGGRSRNALYSVLTEPMTSNAA